MSTSTTEPRAAGADDRSVVQIGPFHPLLEEPVGFELTVEGERVVAVDARMDYIHKGIERLAQQRTYDMIPILLERICGICSVTHSVCFCNAVEDLLGVEPPPRARYIRTIIGELERVHSHLLWVGLAGHFIGYNTVFMWAWKYREPVCDVFEMLTGHRQNSAIPLVGGVRRDLRVEYLPEARRVLDELDGQVRMLTEAVLDDPVLAARLRGVGVLTPQQVVDYGVVGPTARASGVATDVRRDDPYAAYGELDWQVITAPEGDVFAKAVVRLLELAESIKILRQAFDRLPGGDLSLGIRHVPAGEGIGRYEAPRGEDVHYVRSNGTNMPERLKVRAPSFTNIASFQASCIGASIADVTITLAACDPCYSCTERTIVVRDAAGGEARAVGDLIARSQRETRRIAAELGRPADLVLPAGGAR
ncbi:MAG: nickel-dependent hydrogenase large subunit [Planctomycetes bacterium]|nr:nickel-dependent hydrogenase large subunit [Planctomycetota bacterium]